MNPSATSPISPEWFDILTATAANLYFTAITCRTPVGKALADTMRNPKVGDLVMEITTYAASLNGFFGAEKGKRWDGLGTLLSITAPPPGESGDTVWHIQLPDGSVQPWTNCLFIAIPRQRFNPPLKLLPDIARLDALQDLLERNPTPHR